MGNNIYSERINVYELRERSITLLKDIKESLDKHNVSFWIDFGTLLGAVRDKRSIPWDGDFDLSTIDKDVAEKDDLWAELKNKGYNINISKSNIKITLKKWKIGQYRIDLHRYRINDKGDVEYEYGKIFTRKIDKFYQRLLSQLSLQIFPEDEYERAYPTFGIICRCLLDNEIDYIELEKIPSFKVQLGQLNSRYDFIINIDNRVITNKKRKVNDGFNKIVFKIFQFLPFPVKCYLKSFLTKKAMNAKYTPSKRVFFPMEYFKSFEKVGFHGIEINAPCNFESYLERIYGTDWVKPIVTPNKNYLNKISYKESRKK